MYKEIKEEVKEIIEIVKSCPENLQEKCFEVLLNNLLAEKTPTSVVRPHLFGDSTSNTGSNRVNTVTEEQAPLKGQTTNEAGLEIVLSDFHVKVRRFFEQHGISLHDLNKLYYKEGQSIFPLYEELGTTRTAESQIRLSLLTAFENGFSNGEFSFNGEVVREKCKELKCYDRGNFTASFKNNSVFFDVFESYSKDEDIKLSIEGKKELAKVILLLSRGA